MVRTVTCPVCGKVWHPVHSTSQFCCRRCVYIGDMINSVIGKTMSREEGILHYGRMWDDPLRMYRHTKHIYHIEAIMMFCRRRHDRRFTWSQLSIAHDISPSLLGRIATRYDVINRVSKKYVSPAIWEFRIPKSGGRDCGKAQC